MNTIKHLFATALAATLLFSSGAYAQDALDDESDLLTTIIAQWAAEQDGDEKRDLPRHGHHPIEPFRGDRIEKSPYLLHRYLPPVLRCRFMISSSLARSSGDKSFSSA